MSRPEGTTRLDDPLPIPELASEKDEQRIAQVNRNLRIRDEYPRLKDQHGWQEARRILGEKYNVSPATVKMVLDGRR